MNPLTLALLAFTATLSAACGEDGELNNPCRPQVYAVLIAGSNGWGNYRHQADVAHSYHVLINHGVPAENIIVFAYDDIVNDPENPYPGQLFNRPNGTDLYKGLNIDYRGDAVNVANFIAVLKGDASAAKGGRVLKSGPADHVFVFFSDHGGDGLIGFPDEIMTVQQLQDTLKWMHDNEKYRQLTFYLEACEAGSMFENVLPTNISVYAVTASNKDESSWGWYCESKFLPGVCLGDEFSIHWMEDSDSEDLKKETLESQFELVKNETVKSHVKHYGDLSIAQEAVAIFQGPKESNYVLEGDVEDQGVGLPSRLIELAILRHQILTSNDFEERNALMDQASRLLEARRSTTSLFKYLASQFKIHPLLQDNLFNTHNAITDMNCHHKVVTAFHNNCLNFAKNPVAMEYAYVLNNLCVELFGDAETIVAELVYQCSSLQSIANRLP